jgi:hypothetical protein
MKKNIIQRLYDSKQITFDEMLILLDIQEPIVINSPMYSPPPYIYTNPPYVVTCDSTTTIGQNAYSDTFKTYDPKEYKESK